MPALFRIILSVLKMTNHWHIGLNLLLVRLNLNFYVYILSDFYIHAFVNSSFVISIFFFLLT